MSKFGTVVLIPFPFTDLSQTKLRPAVVLSRPSLGKDVIVAFLTSRSGTSSAFGLSIPQTLNKAAGLLYPTILRLDKIATLEHSLILGKIGHIPESFLQRHAAMWDSLFGFKVPRVPGA